MYFVKGTFFHIKMLNDLSRAINIFIKLAREISKQQIQIEFGPFSLVGVQISQESTKRVSLYVSTIYISSYVIRISSINPDGLQVM